MALLFFENFAKYKDGATGWTEFCSDNPDYTNGGTTSTSMAVSSGRFSDTCLSYGALSSRDISLPFRDGAATGTVVNMGALVKRTSRPTSGAMQELFCVTTGVSLNLRSVRLNIHVGAMELVNALGTIVARANGPWLEVGHWSLIEMQVDCVNSGTATVYVDGAQVISVSGIDFLYTTATVPNAVRFFDGITNTDVDYFYVTDSSGSAPFNGRLGDLRVETVIPDADGATANWTASAGSNFQCVDDTLGAYNDDTDYISSSTTDQDNYVSMGTLSAASGTILFSLHTALARNAGSGSIQLRTLSSATVAATADLTLTTSYAWKRKFDFVDPNTAAAWASVTPLNAAEWGVRYR